MARREIPIVIGFVAPLSPFPYPQPGFPGPYPFPQYTPPFPSSITPGLGSSIGLGGINPSSPYMTNYLGTLGGAITPPTAGTGAAAASGLASILGISYPPATAVGTSFPVAVSFVNNSGTPAAFSLIITAAQLGVDQVKTPPTIVQPGQQGIITQQMQMPTLGAPAIGSYVVSIQLVHTDQNGAQIADDSRQFNLPAPTAAVALPGESINPTTGQISSPTGMLPASPVPQPAVPVSTAPGLPVVTQPAQAITTPAPQPTVSHTTFSNNPSFAIPKFTMPTFNFPSGFHLGFLAMSDPDGDGIHEMNQLERTHKAFVDLDDENTDDGFFNLRGYGFAPGENCHIHHHVVAHGNQDIEGSVDEDDFIATADHTGRFNVSLPTPEWLTGGIIGDGIISVKGHRSGKKAHCTSSFR